MDETRRTFLKVAGLSVLGFGAKPVVDAVAGTGERKFERDPNALNGKRWAMVVDQKKCLNAKEGCKECVLACNYAHNVPDFGNPKDEVKWIWQTSYEHAFPGQENPYIEDFVKDSLKGLPFRFFATTAIILPALEFVRLRRLSAALTASCRWTIIVVLVAVSVWPRAHSAQET